MPVMVLTAATLVGLSLSVPQRSVSSESEPCSTVTGARCIFPFRHLGEDHHACTFSGSPVPWCATSTHSDGTLIQNKYNQSKLQLSQRPNYVTESYVINIWSYDVKHINVNKRQECLSFRWGECLLQSSSTCKVETEEERCLTVTGPRAGSLDISVTSDDILPRTFNILFVGTPCIFPFIYSGKVYNQCAEWVHGGENEGNFWCSTM